MARRVRLRSRRRFRGIFCRSKCRPDRSISSIGMVFLCATAQIQLGVGFQQSLGAGIFGGDGFLLQKVTGYGTAWIELSGEVIAKDLRPGRDAESSSGACWSVYRRRELSDHAGAGDQEFDFWRRWPFSGCADRSGKSLAADIADCTAGASDSGVCAFGAAPGDDAGRCGWRDCGIAVGWDEVNAARGIGGEEGKTMVHVEKHQPLTMKGIKAKQWIDRVGGVGSILTGIMCGVIGWSDREAGRSIWHVWAFMCVLLICNGIAMLIHANHVGKKIG